MIPLRDDIPTKTFPVVTILLITVNCLAFLYQVSLGANGHELAVALGLIPLEVTRGVELTPAFALPAPVTLFTSMFLHGGVLHLAGNMVFLWIFGNNVEDSTGHFRYLAFYLFCGAAAAGTHIVMNPESNLPMIGASGAVAGVLGAYILLYPRSRILTLLILGIFIQTVRIPAVYFLGFWFVLQFLSGAASLGKEGAGVAWFAHVGGFAVGLFALPFIKKSQVRLWSRQTGRLR